MSNIPAAAADRLLRNSGAQRVSIKAAIMFAEILEAMADEVAKSAVTFAEHAGRNTVKAKDIRLAKDM
ncbi:MAG: NFYB/HAP3 family transcription factor subunit [DPANN group archaeon]|nr:NFYB/HAP3 family transcription factor subunit [DPANN group archaeon]